MIDLRRLYYSNLESAHLKWHRGLSHYLKAMEILRDYTERKPYRLYLGADGTQKYSGVELGENLPPDVMISIGDALHNWRCSLDHCAYQFWKHDIGMQDTSGEANVSFPISKNVDHYRKGVDKLSPLPDLRTAFYEFEAYPGGKGDELWKLHRLENVDKHRFIPVAVTDVTVSQVVVNRKPMGGIPGESYILDPISVSMPSAERYTSTRNRLGQPVYAIEHFPCFPHHEFREVDVQNAKIEFGFKLRLEDGSEIDLHKCMDSFADTCRNILTACFNLADARLIETHKYYEPVNW